MKDEGEKSRGPLSGVLVLDMSRVLAGPFCGAALFNLGATVIKIERPNTGDDTRAFLPFVEGKPLYFDSVNYGKKSIALNLKDPDDIDVFVKLLQKADVVLENFRPGVMERLGFGWEDLHKKYPSLIYACISGFGHTGPLASHPAYDLIVQCMCGIVSVTGPEEPERPVRPGTSFSDIYGGLMCALGVNAALIDREKSGRGSKVDISMLDCQMAVMESFIAHYSVTKIDPIPLGAAHPTFSPLGLYRAMNGFIALAAITDSEFSSLCLVLDLAPLIKDSRFATMHDRVENRVVLDKILQQKISQWKSSDLERALNDAGVACGPLQNVEELIKSDIAVKRKLMKGLNDPVYQKNGVFISGNPMKYDRYEDPDLWPAPPKLDEHRSEILSWLSNGGSL
ncbi:CaiB/BaiF CoA transferase family protein [Microbulbifer sp. DLAB2-AF]|uniref:CaiB/BaiF CoA transferase family protein n=1 Tax=Microbulbifer sp. DLAB2-AF TaxID=3243395 RepID=UPI00403A13C5